MLLIPTVSLTPTETFAPKAIGPNSIDFSEHPKQVKGPGAIISVSVFCGLLVVGIIASILLRIWYKKRQAKKVNGALPRPATAKP